MYVLSNIEVRLRNYSYRGKETIITYSQGVSVALVIHHEMRMRCIVCGLAGLLYFSTLPHKRYDFRGEGGGKVIEHTICVFLFSLQFLSVKISHSKNSRTRQDQNHTSIFM